MGDDQFDIFGSHYPEGYDPDAQPDEKPRKKARPANFSDCTNRLFARHNWCLGLVERTITHTAFEEGQRQIRGSTKQDLWGFGDYLACHRDHPGAVLVQVCKKGHIATRVRSACTEDASELGDNRRKGKKPVQNLNRVSTLITWLLAGNQFWVCGFEKLKGRWEPTICNITLDVIRTIQAGGRPVVAKLPKITLERKL